MAAGKARAEISCQMNPSLPGCPYYPTVEPPHYPKSDEFLLDLSRNGQDALVYAAEALILESQCPTIFPN